MSLHQRFTAHAVTPCLAALVLLVITVGWDRGTGTVSATTTGGAVVQGGGSCPLTLAQELNSIKTFKKMMPVFRHPRCLNCHGGIPDPLASPTPATHFGVVEIDSTDSMKTCEECHMDGWRVPAAFKWTNKKDVELCSDMKMFSAEGFIDHILRDGGGTPFIEMAFQGKRGLNEGGQTIFEEDLKRPLKAEPPPGTHAQLVQQARDWVKAQGGQFVGDLDCGCIVNNVEVLFHSTLTIVTARVTSTITGEGSVILDLRPDPSSPEWDAASDFRGGTASITWSAVSISQPTGCDGQVIIQSSPPTKFRFWLGLSASPDLKLSLQILPDADLHQVLNRCRLPNGTWIESTMNDPISLFGGTWNALHGQSAVAVMMKATAAMDINKMAALDPKKLQAMMEAMKNNPDPAAAAAQLTALMNQIVPGASQLAAEARNNYKLAIPDNKWCKLGTGTAFLAQCDIDQTITVPVPGGSSQTITEKTTITIGRSSPRKP